MKIFDKEVDEYKYLIRIKDEKGNSFYATPPMSMAEVRAEVERTNIGGEICVCCIAPLAPLRIEFPEQEIKNLVLNSNSQNNSTDSEEDNPAEPVKAKSSVRKAASKRSANAGAGRKRR